jgi:hypothetical protein
MATYRADGAGIWLLSSSFLLWSQGTIPRYGTAHIFACCWQRQGYSRAFTSLAACRLAWKDREAKALPRYGHVWLH